LASVGKFLKLIYKISESASDINHWSGQVNLSSCLGQMLSFLLASAKNSPIVQYNAFSILNFGGKKKRWQAYKRTIVQKNFRAPLIESIIYFKFIILNHIPTYTCPV